LRELIEAMQMLRKTRPQAELVLVGDGPLQAEFSAIAAVATNGVRLTGALSAPNVAQWMSASNLVTLPSYSEGHPNVLVEALACGRPVVATPVGGIPEVVDQSCSVLVAPRDSAALANALAAVLECHWDETALSTRFSRSWADVARETLSACEEAIGEYSQMREHLAEQT
jgi:glycosyltransferase involved in cell wall biosynthesis